MHWHISNPVSYFIFTYNKIMCYKRKLKKIALYWPKGIDSDLIDAFFFFEYIEYFLFAVLFRVVKNKDISE